MDYGFSNSAWDFLIFLLYFVSVQSCRSTTAVIVNSCTSCITGCCTISDICNYEIIHCHLYKNTCVLTYFICVFCFITVNKRPSIGRV